MHLPDTADPFADPSRAAASARRRLVGALLSPTTVALGRVGIGAALTARPQLLTARLDPGAVGSAGAAAATRMLGVRDAALGLGTATAGTHRRRWVLASAATDLGDAAALGLATRAGALSTPLGALGMAASVGAALLQVAAVVRASRP